MPISDYIVSRSLLDSSDWIKIAQNVGSMRPAKLARAFGDEARNAGQPDDQSGRVIYAFIESLLSFELVEGKKGFSFCPLLEFAPPRGQASRKRPSIRWTREQLEVLQVIGQHSPHPGLAARASDFCWIYCKDDRVARHAVEKYRELARRATAYGELDLLDSAIGRSVEIASSIGDAELLDAALADLLSVLNRLTDECRFGQVESLMAHLAMYSVAASDALLCQIDRSIVASVEAGLYGESIGILRRKKRFLERHNLSAEARECVLWMARIYETWADMWIEVNPMIGRQHVEKAIECYLSAGGAKAKIEVLKSRLPELRLDLPKVQGGMETQRGLDEAPTSTRARMAGMPLRECIRLVAVLMNPTSLVDGLVHSDSESCSSILLDSSRLNIICGHTGRKVAVADPIASASEREAGKVRAGFVLSPRQIIDLKTYWGIVAIEVVVPAIDSLSRFGADLDLLVRDLVRENPLIRDGQEEFFVRGLRSGLRKDFFEALALLIPAFESSLRYLLEKDRTNPWTIDSDGVQSVMTLNQLLGGPVGNSHVDQLINLLGYDDVFELKWLLVEGAGANLRNLHAHGLLKYQDYFGGAAVVLYGRILRLVVLGAAMRDNQA